jgi:phage-related protein
MKELGLVTADGANKFFDAAGSAKGLGEIAGELNTALAGMTKQQKLATLETLFGSDAIRAAAVLTDAGAKGFENLGEKIGSIKAADVAAKRMDNLAGSIELFKGSAETAIIQMGAPFQSGIRGLVDAGTSLLNMFVSLAPATQKLIGQIVAFGGAGLLAGGLLLLMFVKLVQFAQAVKAATIAMKAFGIASKLAFVTNPVFLVIAAIVLLVAALVLLFNKHEGFRNFVLGVWASILSAIRAVGSFFTGTIVPAFQAGIAAIVALFGVLKTAWIAAWSALAPIVTPIIAFITGTVQRGIALIVNVIKLFAALLTGNWTAAWNAIKGIASAVWGQITAAIRTFITVIIAAWVAFGARMLSSVISWVNGVLAAIGRFVAALPARILFVIGFLIGRWLQFQIRMVQIAIQLGTRVVQAIVSFFSQLPGRIASFINAAFARFNAWSSRMVAAARSAGSRVLSGIISFLSQLPGRVGSFLSSALSRMSSFASRLPALARQAASGAVSAVASGLAALPGIVSGAVGRAIAAFQGMIGSAFAAAKSLASSLWSGFKAGLFGSPKTKIEYAMIAMRKGFQKEVKSFAKDDAQFKKLSSGFFPQIDRNVTALGPSASGRSGGRPAINVVFNGPVGRGARDEVIGAVNSPNFIRPVSQAVRAKG